MWSSWCPNLSSQGWDSPAPGPEASQVLGALSLSPVAPPRRNWRPPANRAPSFPLCPGPAVSLPSKCCGLRSQHLLLLPGVPSLPQDTALGDHTFRVLKCAFSIHLLFFIPQPDFPAASPRCTRLHLSGHLHTPCPLRGAPFPLPTHGKLLFWQSFSPSALSPLAPLSSQGQRLQCSYNSGVTHTVLWGRG